MAWPVETLASSICRVEDRQLDRARKRVAAAIRRHRSRLGLTQEEAAHEMGLVTRHLQKLEAGEVNVTLRTLVRISVALGVDLKDLF